MADDSIIELGEALRDLKAKREAKWSEDHTHFMDFMTALAPLLGLSGRPVVDYGWQHVVDRVARLRQNLDHCAVLASLCSAKHEVSLEVSQYLSDIAAISYLVNQDYGRMPYQ
jgi:hypothetical protein